ncbi:two-component system, response regulator YesN [Catalinimonas alkaloidigena]|uniref:Two-component system, response regulator YesN n=1 Tax=Catalinimonas alkaloidigena TaxID=1075417 RepID=A0A1G9UZV5_9BACT|nr:response regulator [Catalinimonas alkaloidigena]SDM65296.1 two-component system, response regulator YesN [Catalinimonas alkaloidigena]
MRKLHKILLVDDDEINNYLNTTILKDLDIAETISVALNGKQALEYLLDHCDQPARTCPELVIFDHHMPVMDGLEMIRTLHEKGFMQRANMVFLLLGIRAKQEVIEEFLRLGVQEFTDKPLEEQTVLEAYHKYWRGDTAQEHV